MKFLIAGLGSIGRRHLRNLLALGEQDILLYRTHQSSLPDDVLDSFLVETDLEAALERHPDVVIISNPTALHLNVAIPAAEAGCHIFLEKPISHSLDGIDNLQSALLRGGGSLLVGYHFRFHPGLKHIRSLLSDAAIGQPLSVRAHWGEYLPDWHPWEDYRQSYSARSLMGGGVILTLSHPFDYLRWLLGEVASLWAFTGKLSELEISVEDTAEIGLHFSSGMIGSLHLDYNQRPPAHWLEVVGSAGSLIWNNSDGSVRMFRAADGIETTIPAPSGFERNDIFLEEMRHFLRVARGEESPVCTLDDGVKALHLALAAHRSAREKMLVELNAGLLI